MNKSKKPSQSKTIWINGLTFAAAVLAFAGGHEFVAQYPRAATTVAGAVAAINVVLRFLTSQPLRVV